MCMSKSDVMRKEIIVCQMDQLPKNLTCERVITNNDDLILLNAEMDDVYWDEVHFPLSTLESYYIKTIYEDKQ